jgi:hypothetical protein
MPGPIAWMAIGVSLLALMLVTLRLLACQLLISMEGWLASAGTFSNVGGALPEVMEIVP